MKPEAKSGRGANPEVEWYFQEAGPWQPAFKKLRAIALEFTTDTQEGAGLREELKWGHPCYTLEGKNVVLMHGFKDYCALLFHKGALLRDEDGLLVQQTKNVQAARQIRFASASEVTKRAPAIRRYFAQAIEVERAGHTVARKPTAAFDVPDEFAAALRAKPALKKAFDALTPGRQRAYLLHFLSAKQSATRVARIEKHRPRILAGLGLDD
jgi:uncharacterized protein YdeI (YjbR/CyaY-like superfamily)